MDVFIANGPGPPMVTNGRGVQLVRGCLGGTELSLVVVVLKYFTPG